MSKKLLTTAAAAASATLLSIGAAVAYAPGAQASLTTSCNGTAENVRVTGSLVVPADSSCELVNVTVDGDITVESRGVLIANKGRYKGDVRLAQGATLDMIDGRVDQNVSNEGGYAWIATSQLRGNYQTTDGIFEWGVSSDTLDGVSLRGKIDANTDSTVFIETSTVGGAAASRGTGFFSVDNSQLRGSLTVENAENFPYVCNSEVYGDARFSNNPSGPVIGSHGFVGCAGMNYFGKNLTVESNGYSTVSNSIVVGDLSGEGNDRVVGQNNRVRGEISGQFVNLEPERDYGASGSQSTDSSDLQAQADQAKTSADERRTAATEKARAAGKAF